MHHADFQELEGAWRGLHYLVNNSETDQMLKIRVMNISKKELGKTLKHFKGAAWDQSPIFKKVYEEEYGQLGGEPYRLPRRRLLLRSQRSRRRAPRRNRRRSARRRTPRSSRRRRPRSSRWSRGRSSANPRDLAKIFSTPEYAAWRSLRESEDSRYIGLALPRFLARRPYGAKSDPVEEFDFEEDTSGPRHGKVHAGRTPPTRWRSTSIDRSSFTAGARAFAGSSRAER